MRTENKQTTIQKQKTQRARERYRRYQTLGMKLANEFDGLRVQLGIGFLKLERHDDEHTQ